MHPAAPCSSLGRPFRSLFLRTLVGLFAWGTLTGLAVAGETPLDPAEALKILQQVQANCQKGLPNASSTRRVCSYTPARDYAVWSTQVSVRAVESDSQVRRDGARWQVKSQIRLVPSRGTASPLDYEQNSLWDGNRLTKWQSSNALQGRESAETTADGKRKNDLSKDPYLGYEIDGILTHRDFEDIAHLMIRKKAAESAVAISGESADAMLRFEATSGLWHIFLWTDAGPDHALRKIESTATFAPADDFRYAEGRETVTVTKTVNVDGAPVSAEGTVETVKTLRPLQRTNTQSLVGWLWNSCTASLQERTRVSITRTFGAERPEQAGKDVFSVGAPEGTVFYCPDEPPKDLAWASGGFVPRNEMLPVEERLGRGVRALRVSPTGPGAIEIGWLPSVPWATAGLGCALLAGAAWMRGRRAKRLAAATRTGK